MNISVVLGHPKPGSFNHAIAETVLETLRGAAHVARFHDLYAEEFDPVMPAEELLREALLPPAIAAQVEEIGNADGIIVIHPNWWSQPPAIVRGWTDRVLRAGKAYNFVPDGKGGAQPVGLLKAQAAMVFNTANTPQDKEVELYGDPLELAWRRVVFGLCGVKRVYRKNFAPVITSTPAQRAEWLEEVRQAVRAHFPAGA